MWLTRLAISRPVTVLMGLLSLFVLGAISLSRLPLNFLPHAEFPFIGVQVPYENGIPAQVEREIARPIEEVLATLGGVRQIFSESDGDGSFVGVVFDWGRDVDVLRLEVKEKLDQIRPELPDDVRDIFLFTFNTNDIPIVEGRISAIDRDLSASFDLIEQRIINRLRRVPGVGRVEVNGVEPADVTVYLHLDRIKEFGVDVGELFGALRQSNFDLSLGHVTQRGLRYGVRSISTLSDPSELEQLPIDARGLRLKDVADVVYGTPELHYGRFLNLEPAIAFHVQKSSGANTVDVVRKVKRELERINQDPALDGVDVLMFFDQGKQITDGLEGLLHSGLIGGVLAVGVLYFFLRNLRTTLIVSLAIPISIVGTCTYLYLSGRSLNVLSMMGLMLGVGMLIDNAVVVLESIYRRMGLGDDPVTATLRGTREVGRAVVSATLTSIVVFAPVILGARSELTVWLKEVGVTISITLLCSLLVSLTIIPVLTAHGLRGGQAVRKVTAVETWSRHYRRVLEWTALRHPALTIFVLMPVVIALTVGLIALSGFKPDPMGERGLRQEYLQINYDFKDDVDYRIARERAELVQEELWQRREEYGLRYLYTFFMDGHAAHRLYLQQDTISEEELRALRGRLREELPVLPGVEFRLGDDEGGGSGAESLSVTLHGEDSDELERLAGEVKRRLAMVDGLQDLNTDVERGQREIRVRVDGELSDRLGIAPRDVAEVMGISFRGVSLPRLRTEEREVDLWVMLRDADRRKLEDLRALTVGVQRGKTITLDQIAALDVGRSAQRISRRDQRTAVRIRGSYEGEDFSAALDEARGIMEEMHLPAGYGWNFGESIQRAQRSQGEMGINALLALLCVYMIMASLFESLVHPAVVMSCVPFASLGVIWLMIGTNTPFNLMAMIGMVILIGIVVNNGIVLIDHVNHHRREGRSLEEAVIMGGCERFRPILMTATTTVLGLVPLAIGQSYIGDAQNYPMARAIMGGLISSTVLSLVLLPTYYRLVERIRAFLRGFAPRSLRVLGESVGRMLRRRPQRAFSGEQSTTGSPS